MNLTVKENGVRVANPSFEGTRVNSDQIRTHFGVLLDELGFKRSESPHIKQDLMVFVHKSTFPQSPSSLCVVCKKNPYILSIQRGDFLKNHNIGGEYDLYDFVSTILQSLRDVWVEGAKMK